MRRLLKEPFVHFLAGALLIFAYFWAIGGSRDPASYDISISNADIDRIAADAIRTTNRLPTHDEIGALIDQAVKEEIYYREALRLGLDDGDAVIRRRLANKMRSLNNSTLPVPTDDDLQQWMDDNRQKYATSHQYAFEQIYLGRGSSPDNQEKWLKQLNDGKISPDSIRSPLSLSPSQPLSDEDTIQRLFGSQFIQGLRTQKVKSWQGPIESGFGLHFVKITKKTGENLPVLDDIRQQVTNDWTAAQIATIEQKSFDALAKQYAIKIADFK